MNDYRQRRMKRSQKCSLCLAVVSLFGSQVHLAAGDTTASWVPDSSGVWTSATSWNTNPNYPRNGQPTGTNYLAVINATGTKSYTVTLNTTPITIDGLTINSSRAKLDQTGGSFTPGTVNIQAGTYLLDGSASAINNAAINVSFGEMGLLTGKLNGGSVVANGSGSLVVIGAGLTEIGSPTIQATNFGIVEFQNGSFTNNSNMPTAGSNGIVSIGSGAILDNTGVTAGSSSTLQVPANATLQLTGGTISGGTVNSTGGTLLNATFGTLDGTPTGGITLVGKMEEGLGSTATYLKGLINDTSGFTFEPVPSNPLGYNLILSGNTELRGVGTTTTLTGNLFNAGGFGGNTGTEMLTVDAGHVLLLAHGEMNQSSLPMGVVNNGTIQSDGVSGLYLSLNNGSSSNNGTMEATNGASLTLDNTVGGAFTNTGKLQADGMGSTLVIRGNGITNSGAGAIQANNGATVELQAGNFINNGYVTADASSTFSIGNGAILDNTGTTSGSSSTLRPTPGGTLELNAGGTIRGGTVNSSGGTFTSNFGTLDGTSTGGITLIGAMLGGSGMYLQGLVHDPSGFTFDTGSGYGTYTIYLKTVELSGAGSTTTLANTLTSASVYLGAEQLTIDAGHTLLCQASVNGAMVLKNNGVIQADGSSGAFEPNLSGASTNAGTIEGTHGAVVAIAAVSFTFDNSGTVLANGPGSLLLLGGNGFTNSGQGTLKAENGATVELQTGNFINNGLATADAGSTFSIGGGATFDNSGITAGSRSTLQPPSGGTLLLQSGGSISGGTVNSTGGTFVCNNFGGTLDGTRVGGITLIGKLQIGTSSTISLQGLINDPRGFTFDGSLAAGSGAIYLAGDKELSGNGTTTTITNSNGGGIGISSNYFIRLKIDSGHTLLGQTSVGQIGGVSITLLNNGTVQENGANNQFSLLVSDASNNAGTVKATNGATVSLYDNNGGTFANAGILEASGGGTLALDIANLINTGTIALHNGTFYNSAPLAVGDGTLTGSGTINDDVALASDPSTLAFDIRSNTDFDSLLVNGNISLAGNSATTGRTGGMRKAPKRGLWVIQTATHLAPGHAEPFPDREYTAGSVPRSIRPYSRSIRVPKTLDQTTFPWSASPPGGCGSRSCLSSTPSSSRCCTWGERSTTCGCGPASLCLPKVPHPSVGTIPEEFCRSLCASFRKTPSCGTLARSQRGICNPTSRGLGFANLS